MNNPTIAIRQATAADIPAIRKVAAIAFPTTYADILSPSQIDYMMDWMYSAESLAEQFSEQTFFVAEETDGAMVGYASFHRDAASPRPRPTYHLEKLYVLPQQQGRHLGSRLMDCVIEAIRAQGQPAVLELNVNRRNPALEFYLHKGFAIARTGDFAIGNNYYMCDHIMALEI